MDLKVIIYGQLQRDSPSNFEFEVVEDEPLEENVSEEDHHVGEEGNFEGLVDKSLFVSYDDHVAR